MHEKDIIFLDQSSVALFVVQALSSDGIIYDSALEEIKVKEAMIQNTAKAVFLCDSEKFDACAGYRQCALSDIDCMISEIDCREKYHPYAPMTEFL